MKHTLQLLILFFLIGLFENCSKKKADISPVNPTADFSYEIKDGIATFTNKSENAVKYLWDFGDGQTSIEKAPVHTYIKAGEYKVKLTAESIDGNKSIKALDIVILDKASGANFIFTASSYDTPCIVSFKNESTVVGQYFEWDFGDGFTTTLKDAKHIYIHGGTYTITLNVKDANSKTISQSKKTITINETLLERKGKTIIISRIIKDKNNTELGRDTSQIVYNDINKITFIRSAKRNKESNLILFDYSNNEVRCREYSSDDYIDYTLKLNNKGYPLEISYQNNKNKDQYNTVYKYDFNDYITERTVFSLSGKERESYSYSIVGQDIVQETNISVAGYRYDFETLNSENKLSTDMFDFVVKATIYDPSYLYSSFVYFFNAKPYKNLIKSKRGLRDADFTYLKDTQGRIIKTVTNNLDDKSTIETNISYQ